MTQRLEHGLFKTVVAHTPLISIDLIVRNTQGQVLLGQRLNRPAQDYWFVPGGRICKDETMASAFSRLANEELGLAYSLDEARCLGPYEHFYQDNFAGTDFTTHYVVLGYSITADIALDNLPQEQHDNYRWFDVSELLASDEVHHHTKLYFMNGHQ
ncbi:GDP-mannose mannosyl hydrolase [Photobacterium chitinilyticum]|uniref:GDP-mannose mannosyl hydrolase n=1 Tax=Photobacterium chitinilyticum TaxID=2485123 RepID=A0A3S3QQZ2_9GAMM|nr:GDP-mannose mannosyl hydrolase [Photobacterium chitinilyticum]RWX56594.1 GDP-mannose mannosyl hydrolase [Photobacterium chitinilyticum]